MYKHLLAWNIHAIHTPITRIQAPFNIREQIESTSSLPLLSSSCTRLIRMLSHDDCDLEQLVEIIEMDPMLTMQIYRAAKSAFYNYQGNLDTVREAIVRVIGLDKAFNMAIALATTNTFTCEAGGCIGIKAYWSHAYASTKLLAAINRASNAPQNNAELFLAGFLHNIGYLLLGQYFPGIHKQLSALMEANPGIPNLVIEKFALGICHCEIGAWLSQAWELSSSTSCVILNHHNETYRDEHWQLNLMVNLCDCLLSDYAIGVDAKEAACERTLEALTIDNQSIEQIKMEIPEIIASTNLLAQQIFAINH